MSPRAQELLTAVANTSEHHDLYENPDEMCRAIVEELGITREMVDKMWADCCIQHGTPDTRTGPYTVLATLLDAAGVEP